MGSAEIEEAIDDKEREIRAAEAEVDQLEDNLGEVQKRIGELESKLDDIRNDAKSFAHHLESVLINASEQPFLSSPSTPAWTKSVMGRIDQIHEETYRFTQDQLQQLGSVIGLSSAASRPKVRPAAPVFQYQTGPAAVPTSPLDGGEPSLPLSAEVLKPMQGQAVNILFKGDMAIISQPTPLFITGSKEQVFNYISREYGGQVSHIVYTASTQVWNDPNISTETMGVEVAAAILSSEGRQVVITLGGPGKPDMISLDADNELWISEVKGTRVGTPIERSGLLRTVNAGEDKSATKDPLTGKVQIYENSPEWLRRHGVDVIRNLALTVKQTGDTGTKNDLKLVQSKFAEAVKSGFEDNNYHTELIQVGMLEGDKELAPPGPGLDEYCEDVQPDRIVQVNLEQDLTEADA